MSAEQLNRRPPNRKKGVNAFANISSHHRYRNVQENIKEYGDIHGMCIDIFRNNKENDRRDLNN